VDFLEGRGLLLPLLTGYQTEKPPDEEGPELLLIRISDNLAYSSFDGLIYKGSMENVYSYGIFRMGMGLQYEAQKNNC